ncbi:MAG: methyltransferase domain-containing protein [Planctomycetes bacterium]|nr:methyltransferase domain-containing protein [Planctomycetota bacterium]
MLHRPLTVLKCISKNMLARMGLGPFLKKTLGVSQTEINWATRPVDDVYKHVTKIFQELMSYAGIAPPDLRDKIAVEIGPGTNLGVALMFLVHGCRRVIVVEKADAAVASEKSAALYRRIVEEHGADAGKLLGAASGLNPERVTYYPHAAFEATDRIPDASVDLIYSHQVLEHVGDLDACFRGMCRVLKPGGVAMHVVDLSGHSEFARGHPLDPLRYPSHLWRLMFSHRPHVNRLRLGAYLRSIESSGMELADLRKLRMLDRAEAAAVRRLLSPPFSRVDVDELCVIEFFFLARRP